MTPMFWLTTLVVAGNAIYWHAMPRYSRPDILFAVTVSEAFAAGAGRALVARYRTIVWSGAAAALAIGLLLPSFLPGPEWAALFAEYPLRFMIGSDTWINARWSDYEALMAQYRHWLGALPAAGAQRIAWANAAGLFGVAMPR